VLDGWWAEAYDGQNGFAIGSGETHTSQEVQDLRDGDALFRYRSDGPHADLAVPTPEHFDPIFVTLGAAWPEDRIETVYEGFHYGNISMRSFAFR
jgi:aromatic ring-opening dioxygenase catalytic subunit (LigB family)